MLIIEKPTKTTETKSYKLFTNNFHLKCLHFIPTIRSAFVPGIYHAYLFRFLKLQVVLRLTGTGVLLVLIYRNRCILTALFCEILHGQTLRVRQKQTTSFKTDESVSLVLKH